METRTVCLYQLANKPEVLLSPLGVEEQTQHTTDSASKILFLTASVYKNTCSIKVTEQTLLSQDLSLILLVSTSGSED